MKILVQSVKSGVILSLGFILSAVAHYLWALPGTNPLTEGLAFRLLIGNAFFSILALLFILYIFPSLRRRTIEQKVYVYGVLLLFSFLSMMVAMFFDAMVFGQNVLLTIPILLNDGQAVWTLSPVAVMSGIVLNVAIMFVINLTK